MDRRPLGCRKPAILEHEQLGVLFGAYFDQNYATPMDRLADGRRMPTPNDTAAPTQNLSPFTSDSITPSALKARNRSGSLVAFSSSLAPPYVRRYASLGSVRTDKCSNDSDAMKRRCQTLTRLNTVNHWIEQVLVKGSQKTDNGGFPLVTCLARASAV